MDVRKQMGEAERLAAEWWGRGPVLSVATTGKYGCGLIVRLGSRRIKLDGFQSTAEAVEAMCTLLRGLIAGREGSPRE